MLRNNRFLKYRGVMRLDLETQQAFHFFGETPDVVEAAMVKQFLKYDSAAKSFRPLELNEFSFTVDAFTLKGKWDRMRYTVNQNKYSHVRTKDWEALFRKSRRERARLDRERRAEEEALLAAHRSRLADERARILQAIESQRARRQALLRARREAQQLTADEEHAAQVRLSPPLKVA